MTSSSPEYLIPVPLFSFSARQTLLHVYKRHLHGILYCFWIIIYKTLYYFLPGLNGLYNLLLTEDVPYPGKFAFG